MSFADLRLESLCRVLNKLCYLNNDPLVLCQAAKRFNKWRTLDRLLRSNSSQETRSPWASMRHYVGRLGCWFGKCENLVLTACQFPQILENAGCEFIALPKDMKLPINDSQADLASAMKRMLPANQKDLVQQLYDHMAGMRLFDIPLSFSDNFTDESFMGRVHAEVLLLEHFYFRNFRFWAREKYAGCSKPSCYCCNL